MNKLQTNTKKYDMIFFKTKIVIKVIQTKKKKTEWYRILPKFTINVPGKKCLLHNSIELNGSLCTFLILISFNKFCYRILQNLQLNLYLDFKYFSVR